jgi:hypothetical protein
MDNTLYVSGNKIKLADMRKILGDEIFTFDTNIKEIQGIPREVGDDKITRIYSEQGGRPVGCEDTSFGLGELASYIKQITKICEENEGDLYNVMRSLAPKQQYFDYTSIFSFKDQQHEAIFECTMKCEICPRTAPGMIDPFAIPISYTLIKRVNGETTVLVEYQEVENPNKVSIAKQPENRHLLHPRHIAIGAYKKWRETTKV